MKKTLFILFTIMTTGIVSAQTKLIAHKSHSGSSKHFKTALAANLFGMENSNYGMAPTRRIKTAKLDSLIFVDSKTTVLVTSSTCKYDYDENPDVWSEGKDTVYYHPLFTKQNSLDSIKHVLKTQYNFQNDIDKVTFVGYSNEKPAKNIAKVVEPQIVKEETTLEQNPVKPATTVTVDTPKKQKWRVFKWVTLIGVISVSLVLMVVKYTSGDFIHK